MTIRDKFEPLELLYLYNRFLTTLNDWYGSSNLGMRERMVRPNSFIGLKTYLPSLLEDDDAPDKLSFDLEYEFGVVLTKGQICNAKSVQHLFFGLLTRIINKK